MRNQFADSKGRVWTITYTADDIGRVRDLLGFQFNAFDPIALGELGRNVELLVNVLYVLVKPQCDAAGVTDEDFGRSLKGQPIERAIAAMFAAAEKSLPAAVRSVYVAALAKCDEITDEVMQHAAAAVTTTN